MLSLCRVFHLHTLRFPQLASARCQDMRYFVQDTSRYVLSVLLRYAHVARRTVLQEPVAKWSQVKCHDGSRSPVPKGK